MFFFFKQKTAYEIKECDWSSDVCSSDLDDLPLPPLFGNFKEVRATLTNVPRKDEFCFAVVGDIRGASGIFETIVEELHETPVDFAVLLGDCSKGTEACHRYFRMESAEECNFSFPVFYIAGNHDIDPKFFPISRFEALYGPTLFSFEYQDCLFIALRTIGDPASSRASVDFLRSFLSRERTNYRKVFVFMHIPPPVPSLDSAKSTGPGELIPLFRRLKVDYVFAGHFHGYAQTKFNGTTYIVSGGGGARLDNRTSRQFHHAVVIRVGKDYVSERVLPIPWSYDLEDKLEYVAITKVYPWMSQNVVAVCVLNAGLLAALIGIGSLFYRRIRNRKHGI